MNGPDGYEERTAFHEEQAERAAERADLEEQRADEFHDVIREINACSAVNSFLCCNCAHEFAESQARQSMDGPFVQLACPECGSQDIEDAQNLANIRAMKSLEFHEVIRQINAWQL